MSRLCPNVQFGTCWMKWTWITPVVEYMQFTISSLYGSQFALCALREVGCKYISAMLFLLSNNVWIKCLKTVSFSSGLVMAFQSRPTGEENRFWSLCHTAPHHRWLGITSVGVPEKLGCAHLPLSHKQKELCARKPHLLPSVKEGARLGITECQTQFKHERWNCSTRRDPKVFGYELTSGMHAMCHIEIDLIWMCMKIYYYYYYYAVNFTNDIVNGI